jgi:DNA-binding NtrC family response regulator
VRELRNTLQRAVTLAKTAVGFAPFAKLVFNLGAGGQQPSTLGVEFPGVSSPMPYKQAKALLLLHFERAYVASLMERHDGNVQRAAEAADLSRKHLYELLRRVDDGRSES